ADAAHVPLLNYWRAMQGAIGLGIGPDHVHPSLAPTGGGDLSDFGQLFGYNVRNLTALETLDKLRRVLLLGAPPDLPGGDVAWAPLSSPSLVVSGGSSGFQLEVIDASRTVQFRFDPFPGFRGNVTTALADVNGDGTPDLIAAVGSGGPGHVK